MSTQEPRTTQGPREIAFEDIKKVLAEFDVASLCVPLGRGKR